MSITPDPLNDLDREMKSQMSFPLIHSPYPATKGKELTPAQLIGILADCSPFEFEREEEDRELS